MRLEGAPNFRDLAGQPAYQGLHGRRLRTGRVFRSDHLGQLLPADLQQVQDRLGSAVRVLDLRGGREREAAPCAIPGAIVHSLAIEPTIVQKLTDLLAGRLDAASVGGFKEQMTPILEQQTQVVLDMTHVRFVDSAGLGCLLGSLRTLQQKKGELKVCGLSKAVRSLFEMVRFHRVVEIFPDSNEAVRAFASA